MFKVNKRNTRTRFEICSKLTIKTPERRQLSLLLTYLTPCSSVSIVNFEQVNASWAENSRFQIFSGDLERQHRPKICHPRVDTTLFRSSATFMNIKRSIENLSVKQSIIFQACISTGNILFHQLILLLALLCG